MLHFRPISSAHQRYTEDVIPSLVSIYNISQLQTFRLYQQ
jgi:hypothetical protein